MAALIEESYAGKLIGVEPGPFEIIKTIRLP